MRNLAAILLLTSVALPAFAAKRHTFDTSVPRAHVRRVVVDIPTGDVEVRNSSDEKISVSGYLERNEDDATVVIEVNDDEAIVRKKPQGGWRSSLSDSRIRLEVPPGTGVDVRTKFGDVTIEGRFGDIDVDLRAGDIDVRLPKKDVRKLIASAAVGSVRTRVGDEWVEHEGILPGDTRYVNENGKSIVSVHASAGDVRVTLTK